MGDARSLLPGDLRVCKQGVQTGAERCDSVVCGVRWERGRREVFVQQ